MGKFYSHEIDDKKRICLYSERGVLSYLYSYLMLNSLESVLKEAKNSKKESLDQIVEFSQDTKYTILQEFDLGSEGFGSPDGGLLLESNELKTFVFIEGKAISFDSSFQSPKRIEIMVDKLDPNSASFETLRNKNNYNSSINGQLELRWRFINSFRRAKKKKELVVTEQFLNVPPEYLKVDRFYWRRKLKPQKSEPTDWRRVNMNIDLQPLYDLLKSVDQFILLAITSDKEYPENLSKTRLFDENGNFITNYEKYLFWLPLKIIESQLNPLS